GGVDVHSRRGHIHPAAVVGEGGFVVVAVGGGNGDGIVVVGRVGGEGCAAVAGSSHHDGSAVPGVVDRIPQGRGSDGSAQAEADHVGAVVGGVDDPAGHIVQGAGTVVIQYPDGIDGGVGSHSGDAPAVVGDRGGDSGAVGSVTVAVLGLRVVVHQVVSPDHLTRQLEVVVLNPRADDRNP